jgi:hypothetical protein
MLTLNWNVIAPSMKRIGRGWRVILWFLAIGWIPVALETSLNYLFHIEDRLNETAILIVPYMMFITLPLTCLAGLILLYKTTIGLSQLARVTSARDVECATKDGPCRSSDVLGTPERPSQSCRHNGA